MKVKIKRLDTDLPLPKYETANSVGFDFLCRESVTIEPQTVALIPTNVIIETPPGHILMVTLKRSIPIESGLLILHGVNATDRSYGESDEIQIQVYNFMNHPITIKRGDKIARGFFVRVEQNLHIEQDE